MEKTRKKLNYEMIVLNIMLFVLLILILISPFLGMRAAFRAKGISEILFSFIGLPIICTLVLLFVILRRNKIFKKYSTIIKTEFIPKLLDDEFDEYKYFIEHGVDINKVINTGLVKSPDRYSGEDRIDGVYKGISFEVSDVSLMVRIRTKNRTSYVPYFKGKWYIFNFNETFDDTIMIVEEGKPYAHKGLTKVETEMLGFNEKFNAYTNNEQFFYYVLNANLIARIIDLVKKMHGRLMIYLANNSLHVGINSFKKEFFKIKLKERIDNKMIEEFEEDILFYKTIIDDLSISGTKFNK
ncbi:MAG: DUF3137 domain-containing protein [Acholeplasma sp.]|nr:DUF3137 domain-containing protein [Acholeplasma sp.]